MSSESEFMALLKPTGIMPLFIENNLAGSHQGYRMDVPQSQIVIQKRWTGTFVHTVSRINFELGSKFQHYIYHPCYENIDKDLQKHTYKTVICHLSQYAIGYYTFDLTDFRLNKSASIDKLVCVRLFLGGNELGWLPASEFEDKGDYWRINLFKDKTELQFWAVYNYFGLIFYFQSDVSDSEIISLEVGLSWVANRQDPYVIPNTLNTTVNLKADDEKNILQQDRGIILAKYFYNHHKVEHDVEIEEHSFWVETDVNGQSWILTDDKQHSESYSDDEYMKKLLDAEKDNLYLQKLKDEVRIREDLYQ